MIDHVAISSTFHLTDGEAYRPVSTAVLLIDAIFRMHRDDFSCSPTIDRLAGTDGVRFAIENGTVRKLLETWERDSDGFLQDHERYLLCR